LKKLIIYIFLVRTTFVFSQEKLVTSDTISKLHSKTSYKDFFFDSNRQNHLFTLGLKYQQTISSKAFSSNGLYGNLGLNIARFFSKELIIGLLFDLKPINGFFYRQPKSDSFVRDFNENFNSNYRDSSGIATSNLLKDNLNNNHIYGGSISNIGIMFSVFPNRNGGVLVELKKGYESHRIGNVYGNKFIKNGEADNLYFDFATYTLEISFKPYSIFKNSYIDINSDNQENSFLKSIMVSFFYSRLNLKDAEINGLKWTEIVSSSFISKYGKTNRFGMTLGFVLY
jgi:hypothetical protein